LGGEGENGRVMGEGMEGWRGYKGGGRGREEMGKEKDEL